MLYVRYRDRLFCSMFRLVGSSSAADDLVQDAFLRAYVKLDTFREDSQFYSWLFRIAINLRRAHFRHLTREVFIHDLASWHEEPCSMLGPDHELEANESIQCVRAALGRIEPHHRTILILREYERLSYREIGEKIGVGLGTVRSKLSRARARMRRELKRIANERQSSCNRELVDL